VKIKLIAINARYSHSSPALFYLRNALEHKIAGIETEICQYTINDPYYILLQRIASGSPDYLFFSAVIWNSDLTGRLIEDLLVRSERVRIVVGGPQADVVCSGFDDSRVTCFNGEIEAAEGAFFTDLQRRSLKKSYRGTFLGLRDKTLPYPYRPDDFLTHLANRAVYYESSRGCPFFCTYCLSSAEKGMYHKELGDVFSDLDDILAHSPQTVRFIDRTFNDIPARAVAIWKYIQDKNPDTLFHFEIAPDRFSDEMFAFLETVRPGLFQFEIGIQTTNPDTLAAIRRPIDAGTAGPVIRRLRNTENIHLHADLILGLPFETAATFRRSINDMFAMQPHYIQMGLLKLLPGTQIRQQAAEFGLQAEARPPYAVFANRWVNAEQMAELFWIGECIEQCVNNRYFPSLWRYLVETGEDIAAFFTSLAGRFHEQGYFWKAATQKTLCRLLLETVTPRDDFALIRELICFDWLRCGHRYLPDQLVYGQRPLDELRRDLYHRLPQEIDGLFTAAQRKNFIKSSVFHEFSKTCLERAGWRPDQERTLVCFRNDREDSVFHLNKIALLKNTD